jgi:ferredoxin
MKVTLDRGGCIGCELCTNICPEVFRMAADGYAKVIRESIPREAFHSAVEAQDECPVSVISIEAEV